jgi:TolB-like protein/tetratricopeptide (TPR) repeat protein
VNYIFENHVLDTDRRELRRSGGLVATEPQVFDVLLVLIRERHRVVSKDDLIEVVWHGRIVSESTLASRITEVRHAIGDSGDQQRLIRTVVRKGLRFIGEVREESGVQGSSDLKSQSTDQNSQDHPAKALDSWLSERTSSLSLPDKPSIVVLPFTNLSGDPAQDYFADGMVEDITIALGRLPWLFVIGSGSAFTYKNRAVDTRRVGSDLGVRYVLRGSVRKSENRARITAELTDALHGGHIWADRFEGELSDVFDMQDKVASHVSAMIAPALQSAEFKRSERKPTENLTAYDLYLRASRYQRDDPKHNRESLRLLERAVDIDRSYGAAYGLGAFCHFWRKVLGWVHPTDPSLGEGIRLANLGVEHGANDSEALWMAAQSIVILTGDVQRGIDWVDRSLALNPNSPSAWWTSVLIRAFSGDSGTALEHAARAQRLDPLDPMSGTHKTATGVAHFFAGRYQEAADVAEQVLKREPKFPPALRLSVAASGRLKAPQASSFVKRLLEVRPTETVRLIEDYYSSPLTQNRRGLEDYLEGLRSSGLPEA